MSKVLIVCEQRNSKLKTQNFELIACAKTLSADVTALIIGHGIAEEAKRIAEYGVANILISEAAELENYSSDAYAGIVKQVVQSKGIDVVLLSASAWGKDLSAHIGILCEAAVAQDCIKVNSDLTAIRPTYAGKILANVNLETAIKVYSIRANSYKAEPSSVTATIESVPAVPAKLSVAELLVSENRKLDVAEASIIVTGGRGMSGPDHWDKIENLASVLGAATGASRAVVDAGWRPHSEQVGQTGKTVSPSLYIACGVSGAIQHLAGMKTSKYIVAINKDPEAPIFKVADFGIVGDVMDVLPKLSEEIKKLKT